MSTSKIASQPAVRSEPSDSPREHVVYVTPDCTDSAVQKRAHGFLGAGVELTSFSFRRMRYNEQYVPDWPNIELGVTTERRLFARLFIFLRAVWVIWGHARTWQAASVLYVRNLDLAVMAVVGKAVTRCTAPIVYEVLDIHPALTNRGPRGLVLRWLERRVLAQSQLLVVSSPAFLQAYFSGRQGYQGESFLLENKWPSADMSRIARKIPYELSGQHPQWIIGWFGNIRCAQSLRILTALADRLPNQVKIYIRGYASLLGEGELLNVIRHRENMVFEGEYKAPLELATIYAKVHFNWCGDLDDGENSRWLLPNRLYEGGYFGIPALAISEHETGRTVRQRQLGITLDSPVAEQLADMLSQLTREDYVRLRSGIESQPVTNFVDDGDLSRMMRRVSRYMVAHDTRRSTGVAQRTEAGRQG